MGKHLPWHNAEPLYKQNAPKEILPWHNDDIYGRLFPRYTKIGWDWEGQGDTIKIHGMPRKKRVQTYSGTPIYERLSPHYPDGCFYMPPWSDDPKNIRLLFGRYAGYSFESLSNLEITELNKPFRYTGISYLLSMIARELWYKFGLTKEMKTWIIKKAEEIQELYDVEIKLLEVVRYMLLRQDYQETERYKERSKNAGIY